MMTHRIVLGLVLAGLAGTAAAQSVGTNVTGKPGNWRGTLMEGTDAVIATNSYGEPLFVASGDTVAPMFAPAPMTAERLASEFKRLCIDTGYDQAKLAAAAPASTLGLTRRPLTIPAGKKGPAYAAEVWHGPAARVQIWSGDASGLNNRETISRWRNGATTGPFKDSRMFATACNVTVVATGFDGAQPFVAALSRLVGAEPRKSVVKSSWADGNWAVAGGDGRPAQLFYSMTDLDKAEALLHVAVAPVPAKAGK